MTQETDTTKQDVLAGRNILLSVTGGIAAYKSCSIVTALRKRGASVRVVMTENATRFVSPMTFSALSGAPVQWNMWAERTDEALSHISLQDYADAMLVCPATANVISKVACGIADDLMTAAIMAATYPVGFAPAMNAHMWEKPAVQENVALLRQRGYWFVGPEYGRLASGAVGGGRLSGQSALLACIERMLVEEKPRDIDLTGCRVLITGGPTREFMDPVRFLGNPSSGKMGFALADAAASSGAQVTLVSGAPASAGEALGFGGGFEVVEVTSAAEMLEAVRNRLDDVDVFIGAAAVADYSFVQTSAEKLKKSAETLHVELQKTPDIIKSVSESPQRPTIVVGFAAESHDVLANAEGKLKAKGLDLIVANSLLEPGSGFGTDTNRVTVLGADGFRSDLPLMSKYAVAVAVLEEVARRLEKSSR